MKMKSFAACMLALFFAQTANAQLRSWHAV